MGYRALGELALRATYGLLRSDWLRAILVGQVRILLVFGVTVPEGHGKNEMWGSFKWIKSPALGREIN